VGSFFDNLLSIVTFLPLVGALLVAFLPKEEGKLARGIALWTTIVVFLVSLGLLGGFEAASPKAFQLETKVPWFASLGVSYHVGVDGVSLLLVLLTTFLMPIVVISATSVTKRVKEFALALLVLETAMLGAFVALDLVLFYVFWELMLIPMFLIIGVWGSENRIYAAVKFFIYTMVGSLLMLVAILYLYWATGAGGASRSFDYQAFLALQLAPSVQVWLFIAFGLAFAVKVPMFPLHTWLPDAHVQAPAAGSVILAGVLLKMGTYGFYRFAFPFFPQATLELRTVIVALAVIGIVYGSLMSLAQRDMKKLVAYSSVAHLGFVMLGLAALTRAGVSGAVYQMLNHGLSTGALFLLIGMIYERRHTRLIADYGGIAKVVPAFATVWLIVTLSSIGLPGTNGFVGEFLILSGTFVSELPHGMVWGTVAATGVVLGAVYMLWMYQRVWQGEVRHEVNRHIPDLQVREWAALLPILILIFVMGLFPTPFLDLARPGVERLVARIEAAAPAVAGDPAAALTTTRPGSLPGGKFTLPPGLPQKPVDFGELIRSGKLKALPPALRAPSQDNHAPTPAQPAPTPNR
jgi:NADH-quinone oxidoreductase subunit M